MFEPPLVFYYVLQRKFISERNRQREGEKDRERVGWQELFQRSVTVNFNSINGRESHWRGRSRGGGASFPQKREVRGEGRDREHAEQSIHSLFSSGFQPGARDLPTPLSHSLFSQREKSFS